MPISSAGQATCGHRRRILDRALHLLDEKHDGVPVLGHLLHVLRQAPEELRVVALDRGDEQRYRDITENLEASLIGLTTGGRLGQTFSQHTSNPMRRDRPVVFDVSGVDDSEMELQAAALLACWSAGGRGPAPSSGLPVPSEPAGKIVFPLVREIVAIGARIRVPVVVACRVLGLTTLGYYKWLKEPVSRRD